MNEWTTREHNAWWRPFWPCSGLVEAILAWFWCGGGHSGLMETIMAWFCPGYGLVEAILSWFWPGGGHSGLVLA